MELKGHRFLLLASILSGFALLPLFSGCGSQKPRTQQDWFSEVQAQYPDRQWLTSTGSGWSLQEAKDQAIANLSRSFSMSVQSRQSSSRNLREYFESHSQRFEEEQRFRAQTQIRSELSILNVRTLEEYKSKDGKYYALAGLNRAESIMLFEAEQADLLQKVERSHQISSTAADAFEAFSAYTVAQQDLGWAEALQDQINILNRQPIVNQDLGLLVTKQDSLSRLMQQIAQFTLRGDLPESIKNTLIQTYESVGLRYAIQSQSPMLHIDATFKSERALTDRTDAIFYNWTITLQHKSPDKNLRLATYQKKERSGSTTENNAKSRMEYDAIRSIQQNLSEFIKTELFKN